MENALHFKPPIGFFRNFVVESKGRHRDAFDIKSAMTPIVDFARVYALKNRIDETNTLERLDQLRIKKVLSLQEYEELEKAYSFLMQLRFVRQITAVMDEGAKPDNYINPKKLTHIEQTMLKNTPIKRLGEPADMANAALFLCSPAAGWISGQVVTVSGGGVQELD